MYSWTRCCLLAGLMWTVFRFDVSYSEVYTSSRKIEDMVLQEEAILNNLQAEIIKTNNLTAFLTLLQFRKQRIQAIHERERFEGLKEFMNHPNALYHSVVEFATEYGKLRSALGNTTSDRVEMYLEMTANFDDVVGASRSLIRIQSIYNLSVWNMIKGDYLGYMGPELGEQDAANIGEIAFIDGHLNISLAWLQEALTSTIGDTIATNNNPEVSTSSKAHILATIGRIYIRQGRFKEAEVVYKQAKLMGPANPRVLALGKEFIIIPEFRAPPSFNEDYKRLCSIPNKLTPQQQRDPRLNCVYTEVTLPYYRFQQELLSVSPYITVFYNVLTDSENDQLIMTASESLGRATVQDGDTVKFDDYRTSELSVVPDRDSDVAETVSKRIGAITRLDIGKFFSHRQITSESLQIVNYGIGGHYYLHFDPLEQPTEKDSRLHNTIRRSGNRVSTFLLYLSDVAVGGATVFPKAGVSVKPVKNMAAFWYNYKPSGEIDKDTLHAGCPVVIGHKWEVKPQPAKKGWSWLATSWKECATNCFNRVANKWIWSNVNTFTRRCGLSEDASQLDIEPYMRNAWA